MAVSAHILPAWSQEQPRGGNRRPGQESLQDKEDDAPGLAEPLRRGDPLADADRRQALILRLCGNTYLRISLQQRIGMTLNNGQVLPLLNCFETGANRLRARTASVLAGLDGACPGADVVGWVRDPRRIPAQGCGIGFVEPDWGIRPLNPPSQ